MQPPHRPLRWCGGLALLLVAACRREPPPARPVQRDTIPRQHTIVWHARVARARAFPLAVGAPCRFEAHVGYGRGSGALDLLFRGRCGAVEVYAPLDEDLGTGALLETGQRRCTLDAHPLPDGRSTYALRCPAHVGPPGTRSHRLIVDGRVAHLRRFWHPGGSLDLDWDPDSEPVTPRDTAAP